jgi:putative salt-induced outer membrane protein
MRLTAPTSALVLTASLVAAPTFAQAPPPAAPKIWAVAAGAGLAMTSGNSDTSSFNAAYDLTYDPQSRNIVKSDALLLRGKTQDELSAERFGFNVRDQYKLTPRAYVFGQNQYLHDKFKDIDYLVAPTGGVGYRIIDTPETKLDADGGAGVVWEKNPEFDVKTSGAITAGEKLARQLTSNTTFTQTVSALWKTKDFEDALYTFGIGVAAAMSTRTQLKIELLDTYKNRPPVPTVKKNDLATVLAVVYKI